MDDLADQPFKLMLSYLSIEDVIKARAVSRTWKLKIDNYRVKSLCYSSRPSGFIWGKGRWVSGVFAQNFIRSTRFASFFNTFGRSILSNLKHLRICDLVLKEENPTFIETLQSFSQLEELDIIRTGFSGSLALKDFKLSLPILTSVQLDCFYGIGVVTLDTPRLQKLRIRDCLTLVEIVHVESVERVTIDHFEQIPIERMKNLKQLYVRSSSRSNIDSTLLFDLGQLNEIHLGDRGHVPEIFKQKQLYGRDDLKVYLFGLLQFGPDEPEMNTVFDKFAKTMLVHLAENQWRLADEIPFHKSLHYSAIESWVAPELAIDLVSRFPDLEILRVDEPIRDFPKFLDFLKNFQNIANLRFECAEQLELFGCVQPQGLFDWLPECCAIQKLIITRLPPDCQFLFRCKHLMHLQVLDEVEPESVRRILEELDFLSPFLFIYNRKTVAIYKGKEFRVSVEASPFKGFKDLNSAIEHYQKLCKSDEVKFRF